jgi:hypothetical protein
MIDRCRAHLSAPDVYDPPETFDMCRALIEAHDALARVVRGDDDAKRYATWALAEIKGSVKR